VDFAEKSPARPPKRLGLPPAFGTGGGEMRADHGAVEHVHQMRGLAGSTRSWKNASSTPVWLRRQKRFQMLFQRPNAPGSARHIKLWIVRNAVPPETCDHSSRVGPVAIGSPRKPATPSTSRLPSFPSASPASPDPGLLAIKKTPIWKSPISRLSRIRTHGLNIFHVFRAAEPELTRYSWTRRSVRFDWLGAPVEYLKCSKGVGRRPSPSKTTTEKRSDWIPA
jgi:hypothetical protein